VALVLLGWSVTVFLTAAYARRAHAYVRRAAAAGSLLSLPLRYNIHLDPSLCRAAFQTLTLVMCAGYVAVL